MPACEGHTFEGFAVMSQPLAFLQGLRVDEFHEYIMYMYWRCISSTFQYISYTMVLWRRSRHLHSGGTSLGGVARAKMPSPRLVPSEGASPDRRR